MALYTRESIERLRDAVDMVELVGSRTDLRRVGSRWTGLCPFHDERTPSFSVNAEHKLYHCFGCGASGDAIGFVRESEALDFREAVELLADRYGVELEPEHEDPRAEERRRRRERLLALLERATRFYASYLWESSEARRAREYLGTRGLPESVLRDFRVGYSPSAWDRVTVGAQRDGFTPEELVGAGLAQRGRGGGLYDRFRGRIMFPLADGRGRVLGFGARAMGEGRGPKYLNTSENEIYHKGRQLFGLHRARPQAAKAGRAIVVEGYTDVLALHAAGIPESVAIMGTALTGEQLAELHRAVGDRGRIFLALDADRSGHEATLRAARGASDRDVELRVVVLPGGRDPADIVTTEGAAAMGALIEAAIPVLEFEVRRLLADGDLETPVGRDRVLHEARALIASTPEQPATRERLMRYVSDKLDVPMSYVAAPISSQPTSPRRQPDTEPESAALATGGRVLDAERAFLAMCLRSGEVGRRYVTRVSPEHLSSDVMRGARDHVERHFDDPLGHLPGDDPALSELITRIAMGDEEPAEEPVLRMSFLQLEARRIDRELRRATERGELERQDELAFARQKVRREMDAVMGQAI